jgi:anti-sigma factor RsiW
MSGAIDPHQEELLNGLIDGELTAAEEADLLERLDRDRDLAGRLQELEACRTLLGALPKQEVPVELPERVRQILERRSLLGETPSVSMGGPMGRRSQSGRWVAAAAAIGLVGALSVLIYSILLPPGGSPSMTASTVQPVPVAPGAASDSVMEPLTGRLDLRVASLEDMAMFFNRTLESHGVGQVAQAGEVGHRRVYHVRCSPDVVDAVLADLEGSWHLFEESTFYLDAGPLTGPVKVASITPDQLSRIVRQGSSALAVEVAREAAVFNSVSQGMPSQDILVAVVEKNNTPWPVVPKPVMTSAQKTVVERPKPAADSRLVDLTVVLAVGR